MSNEAEFASRGQLEVLQAVNKKSRRLPIIVAMFRKAARDAEVAERTGEAPASPAPAAVRATEETRDRTSASRKVAEVCGWYGTSAIVLAYVLVSFKIVPANGVVYQLLNLTGALGIIVISTVKRVKQSVVLNIFWAAIAIVALAVLVARR